MIRNIGNSFIGGFFRRLGSIFALFFILALIGYLLKDLDTDSLVNKLLGIQKVKADSIYNIWAGEVSPSNIWSYDSSKSGYYVKRSILSSVNYNNYFDISNTLTKDNVKSYLYINGYFEDINKINQKFICDTLDSDNNCLKWVSNDYLNSLELQIWAGNYSVQCSITFDSPGYNNNSNTTYYFSAKCPFPTSVNRFYYHVFYRGSENTTAYFGINRNFTYEIDTNKAVNDNLQGIQDKQQQTNNKLDEANNQLQETNDLIKNDNTTEATDEAEDLFTNTQFNSHGITGIITAPLNLIQSLLSKTCTPLELPLPFVNENLSLPCMTSIYQQNFPTFLTLYQLIISALIGYRICVSVFFMVKDFKNPDSDKIEVLDL